MGRFSFSMGGGSKSNDPRNIYWRYACLANDAVSKMEGCDFKTASFSHDSKSSSSPGYPMVWKHKTDRTMRQDAVEKLPHAV